MAKLKQYEKYKDSGIPWIGKIPEHWEVKKLKYLTINYDSKRIPLSANERNARRGEIPYYGATGIIDYIDDFLFEGEYILIGEDGAPFFEKNRNVAFLVKGKFWVNNHAHILKPKQGNLSKILVFQLNCVDYHRYITGSTRDKLTQDQLNSIDLLEIPLDEQISIAKFLDRKTAEIDELIAKKERLLELYEEEKKAVINKAITKGINPNVKMKDSGILWLGEIPEHWKVKKLKYVIEGKLKYGANEAAIFEDPKEPRYIRITDFDAEGKLRRDTFKSLPYDLAKEYLLDEGDILFARSGATVGKTFQFKKYKGLACFAGYLIKASPFQQIIISDYLYYFTKSSLYERWKESIFSQATIQNIGADKYSELLIPIPPYSEQQQIVSYLEKQISIIESKIEKTNKMIELLKEYKTSLISEVVTGKRKVTED